MNWGILFRVSLIGLILSLVVMGWIMGLAAFGVNVTGLVDVFAWAVAVFLLLVPVFAYSVKKI
jgi:hypothetical protein